MGNYSSNNNNNGGAATHEIENQTSNPNPSLTLPSGQNYEVFLSFRGETRRGFTDHLYRRLVDAGVLVFRDSEELRVGDTIAPELLRAIKASKISIPVISSDYASSKWCLNELVHILECMNSSDQCVLPIFYKVEPSDVRNQKGSFGKKFMSYYRKHDFDCELVQKWKKALVEVSSLKGWESEKVANGHEAELVTVVVKRVLSELRKAIQDVPNLLVGVNKHVKKITRMMEDKPSDDVQIIGIWGMGGIGKTTLAKIIYNDFVNSFDYHSFVSNIREASSHHTGMEGLQKQVISDILMDKSLIEVSNIDEGIAKVKQSYKGKRLLLVLDDIENMDQLNKLAGDRSWFGPQSIIVITTRNKEVIEGFESSLCYELEELDFDQSFQLFREKATKKDGPLPIELETIAEDIVRTTGGLPLAIEVIGSSLFQKNKDFWKATLEKLKEIPNKEVQEKLKISYDALEREEQQIFLDIACLPLTYDLKNASYYWDACGYYPNAGIQVLVSLSLIKVGGGNQLIIHDQLRDLGREIVRREGYDELGKRSRLWDPHEAMEVIQQKRGTEKVQALILHGKGEEFTNEHFKNLTNLRFLSMEGTSLVGDFKNSLSELRWLQRYSFLTNPCHLDDFLATAQLNKLVFLRLSRCIFTSWGQIELARKLKVLIAWYCSSITTTPDFSAMSELEVLNLWNCKSLKKIHPSIGKFNKTLKVLDVRSCKELEELPIDVGKMEELTELMIDDTCIREIPIFEGFMTQLKKLSASGCISLTKIPKTIGKLESLTELNLKATGVTELPDSIEDLNKLKFFDLSETPLKRLPTTIQMLGDLQVLNLKGCQKLESLSNLPCSLTSLEFDGYSMETLPDISYLINLKHLLYNDDFERRDRALYLGKLNQLDDFNVKPLVERNYDFMYNDPPLVVVEDVNLILEISSSLVKLYIDKCHTLRNLNISNLKRLSEIKLKYCCGLMEINGLEEAESLTYLEIANCYNLSKLSGLGVSVVEFKLNSCRKLKSTPHLTTAMNLKNLSICKCHDLVKVPGLDNIEGLQDLTIKDCSSLEKIGDVEGIDKLTSLESLSYCTGNHKVKFLNLSMLRNLKRLYIKAEKLTEIQRLDSIVGLQSLNIDDCSSLERIGDLSNLKMLKDLSLWNCEKLGDVEGIDKLTSLESLSYYIGNPKVKFLNLSMLRNLKTLSIKVEKLIEIQGLNSIEGLQILDIDDCSSLERIGDLSNLKMLKDLSLQNCEKLGDVEGIDKLISLESLSYCIGNPKVKFLNLSMLRNLKTLSITAEKLTEIQGLDSIEGLQSLDIDDCSSLERIGDLSNLKMLKDLSLQNCEKLGDVEGIDKLTSLESLSYCTGNPKVKFLNLSMLRNLKTLSITAEKLTEIKGLDSIKGLQFLTIDDCSSLERIGDLSNLKGLKHLSLWNCEKLGDVEGIDRLTSLESLSHCTGNPKVKFLNLSMLTNLKTLSIKAEKLIEIRGLDSIEGLQSLTINDCSSLERIGDLSKLKMLKHLSLRNCEKLGDVEGIDKLTSY